MFLPPRCTPRLSLAPRPLLLRHLPRLLSRSPSRASSTAPHPEEAMPTPLPPPINPNVPPPPEAYRSPHAPIQPRKPAGFEPAVQRWSAILPETLVVGTFGVQARGDPEGEFTRWAREALAPSSAASPSPSTSAAAPSSAPADADPDAPCISDHARHTDAAGYTHHVAVAYWRTPEAYARWAARHEPFWASAASRDEGIYREVVTVPAERAETIYWRDYPGGLMRDPRTELYPTPYCGYYGAMRDRLACAAESALEAEQPSPTTAPPPNTCGRWRVTLPRNVAVIRSAHTWQYMDAEQRGDYERRLKHPLARGMDFLASGPSENGCLSLRWLTVTDAEGNERPEAHATAYFSSLGHMEAWAERHRTHAAIFGAAVARYKHYGGSNQLRTWHEVFVLPEGQTFEYINCHPETGLLPYFGSERCD